MNIKRLMAVIVTTIVLSVPVQSAMAAPGLSQQMKINSAAVKIANAKCGVWTKTISHTRKTCRFKVLKSNGYVALYDFSDLPTRLDPHAAPAGDTYAAR